MIKNITAVLALVIVALGGALIIQKGSQNLSQIPANTQLAQVASVDITSGLVGYWNFDNGTASDSSGSGNNGSVSGATAATGKIGGGLSFNGTSQSVNLPASLPTLGNFTFSAWVYINSIPSGGNVAIWAKDSNNRFLLKDGYQYLAINNLTPSMSTPGNTGAWIHIAIVRDGSNATFYRNGSSLGSWNVGTGAVSFGSSKLGTDGYWNFNGIMDEVRLYNTALNSSQISALVSYTGVVTPPTNYTLTVTMNGTSSSGAVSATPIALGSCNATTKTCTATVPAGTVETITASVFPGSNSAFVGWGGACSGTSSCAVTVNTNTSVTATFNTTVVTDTTAPTVSGVSVSNITTTGATLSWSVNETSNSQVLYGLTTSYGSVTTASPSTSVTLSGLTPNTVYHYKIQATDASNNVGSSADATFTTLPNPTTGKFSVGQKVSVVNSTIQVRSTPDASTGTNKVVTYPVGTVATVTAAPAGYTNPTTATGYTWWYATWSTGQTGWSTEDRLAAYTAPSTYSVTINTTTGTGSGTVACNPSTCTVNAGSSITLTATPTNSNSIFSAWSGACTGSTATTCTFTPTANTLVTAVFTSITTTDATPPTIPTNLVATAVSSSQVNLTWTASTDNVGVKGYYVYRDGVNIANITPAATSFSNTTVVGGMTYAYTVQAYDAAGNISVASASVSATTPVVVNVPVVTITASPSSITSGQSSTLTWSATNTPTSCTASGAWSGSKASSGTATVAPTANSTYSLSCTNSAGTSATVSTVVSVGGVVTGALPVDAYQDMEGAFTDGKGAAGWSTNGGVMVSTSKGIIRLPGPVSIGGTTYTDPSDSKSWYVNDDTQLNHFIYAIPSVSKISVAGYVTPGPRAGLYQQYDLVNVGNGTVWGVAQLYSGNSSQLSFRAHSTLNGVSQFGNDIPVVKDKTYWVSIIVNGGAGSVTVNIYDPTNWTLLGTSNSQSNTGSVTQYIRIGRADTHYRSGIDTPANSQTYFDNFIVDYTNAKFPLLPNGTVVTNPAPTASLTTTPSSITSGQSATLAWSSTNATSCVGTGFSTGNAISGSVTVSPTVTTSYSVSCTGTGGTATKTASVTVGSTQTYTLTPSAGANGTISPASSVTVNSGASQTFNISGNTGYGVANVLVDGASVGAVSSYTFSNVTANHTISATFSPVVAGATIAGIPVAYVPTNIWSNAGVPGGIPGTPGSTNTGWTNCTTTDCNTLYGGNVTATTIQNAINSAPAKAIIRIPAGTFNVSAFNIYQKDNWVLRGAGMGQTTLRMTPSGVNTITIGSSAPWDGGGWQNTTNTNAAPQGATSVTVTSASGYAIGDLCIIDMVNSGWIQPYGTAGGTTATGNYSSVGKLGTWPSGSTPTGERAQGHYCKVTGVSGNTISFTPPLPYALESGRTPQISKSGARGPQMAGLEDMTILDATKSTGTRGTITVIGTYAFWLKNIEVKDWGGLAAIWALRDVNMEIRGVYLHDPSYYAVDHGYGMQLDPVSNSLVTDNIIYNVQSSFLMQGASDSNVISYNAFAFGKYTNGGYTGEWLQHDMNGNHSPFPSYNLFEGNYTSAFQSDFYYGPSGWTTLYRNRIPGNSAATNQHRYAISIDANQRYYSIVGNQLGERTAPNSLTLALPGVTRTYAQPGTISWTYDMIGQPGYASSTVFRLGYPYSGRNDYVGTTPSTNTGFSTFGYLDQSVKTTGVNKTLVHGNWDSAKNAVTWESGNTDTTLPNSLYSNGTPSWWPGSLAWPPYGPSSPVSTSNDLDKIPAGYRLQHGTNPL